MSEIIIRPIFNQSVPGIWDDFIRIYSTALYEIYGIRTTDKDIATKRGEYQKAWTKKPGCFAFGAYDGKDMIGFVTGATAAARSELVDLFLLPGYQGCGIGSNLLKSAENAVSLHDNKLYLISMGYGRLLDYYKSHGYKTLYADNVFVKDLKKPNCYVTPVFSLSKRICKYCTSIATQSNTVFYDGWVNDLHSPMFVYVDVNFDIQGYAIANDAGVIKQYAIASRQPADFISRRLAEKITQFQR